MPAGPPSRDVEFRTLGTVQQRFNKRSISGAIQEQFKKTLLLLDPIDLLREQHIFQTLTFIIPLKNLYSLILYVSNFDFYYTTKERM